MTQYDFSPLHGPLTNDDTAAFRTFAREAGHRQQTWGGPLVRGVLLPIALILLIFLIPFVINALTKKTMGPLLVVAVVVAIMFGISVWIIKARTATLVRLYKFTRANDGQLLFDQPDPMYRGLIFDNGHSQMLNEAVIFKDGIQLGNFTYVTGGGKNRSTHRYGFARVALTRHVPHMVLDARQNNFLGMTNLPDSFNRSQRLTLEGDFNDHFDVYVPKEYERDALYIFTPDVMRALIDHGSRYDIEVVDNELYLYTPGHMKMTSEEGLRDVLGVISAISTELLDQTKRYADERVAGSVHPGVGIAETGRRLKRGWNPFAIGIVVIIVSYNLIGSFMPSEFVGWISLGFWAFVAIFVVGKLLTRHRA